MKFTRKEKHDIHQVLKGVREMTISVIEGAYRIEQILSDRTVDVTDEEIEIRLAMSIFAATPEFEEGFYTGGREMAKWVREKITGKWKR